MTAVANLPLAMANVALPSIGVYFDASQTQLNLVAVAYSLGLACSVLWLGALGDCYGRKMMAILGVALAIPAALISGMSPTILPALFAGAFMILAAPRSAKMIEARGSRFTLLAGYVFVFLGFLTMLLFWQETASFWVVVL